MNQPPVTKKELLLFCFLSAAILLSIFFLQINNDKTKVVFCDVGQGDAAYMRIKNRFDILIDAGPDRSVLNCLGKYMPFWDREIELAILTHPNNDHYNGFFEIINRYKIDNFLTIKTSATTQSYKKLVSEIMANKIPFRSIAQGDRLKLTKEDELIFFWPPKSFVSNDDNDYSLVFLFEEVTDDYRFRLLFSGDASPFVMNRLLNQPLQNLTILKIPHHGSKNGLTENFLELAEPRVTVISVGKNNLYGHPAKTVLELLKSKNVKIKRTDINGNILFRPNDFK
ncbi:hypothetical protein M1328_00550 [Patescibacteria group bacterium]|nr:hypothetical protein [Patescibacteria group bacterium]